MKEFFGRLRKTPGLAFEIGIASSFANVLGLAVPLFVIQVLNRYVTHGVDSTLATLTTGVFLAIILEYAFRKIRLRLGEAVSFKPDTKNAITAFNILLKVKASALKRIPQGQRQQIISATSSIEKAYGSGNIGTIFDIPFALLFVGVLFLLSPLLSGIVLCFAIVVFVLGTVSALQLQKDTQALIQAAGTSNALIQSATAEIDTVRAFNASSTLSNSWLSQSEKVQGLRRNMESRQNGTQTIIQTTTALMSVLVVATGATLVVGGKLDLGAMIGANILAARALIPISRFAQLGATFAEANAGIAILKEFAKLPQEANSNAFKPDYKGGLEFRDVSYTLPGMTTPLFETLSLKIKPGTVLIIRGSNGTGKTTLASLITGILDPVRGHILADGLDLRQASSDWWRKQIIYLPQEPTFLNTSIRENLTTLNPEINQQQLSKIITIVGLTSYLDESALGLETQITENGRNLSLGIRRRLALARALTTDGMLVVFDEPTEGMDNDGVSCIFSTMKDLASRGRTFVVVSHDPKIVRGAHVVIDLNVKPVPRITERQQPNKTIPTKGKV